MGQIDPGVGVRAFVEVVPVVWSWVSLQIPGGVVGGASRGVRVQAGHRLCGSCGGHLQFFLEVSENKMAITKMCSLIDILKQKMGWFLAD